MNPTSHETYEAPDGNRLISRFWQSASGFWRGPQAWAAWLLIALLITTVLLQLLTQYWLNFWNRDFFNAIERKDGAELWEQALRFVPIAAASLVLALASVWGRMTMQRRWREWLSNFLYDCWLERDHYRQLRFTAGDHQTPEYRIAEDARVATDLPIDLTLGLFSSFLTSLIFISILWSVGGDLVIRSFGLIIPGYLVIAVAAFAMVQASFNWITDSYGRLAEWRSSANRVASLLLALDQIDGPKPSEIFTEQTRAAAAD